MGDLNDVKSEYTYKKNVDETINENGRHLAQLLFSTSSALPINHLQRGEQSYDGGYTFMRNENQKSQIDWCLGNRDSLKNIEGFRIRTDCPPLSDHKPIEVVMKVSGRKSLNYLVKAACDLNFIPTNHSRFPKINQQNTNMSSMERLLRIEMEGIDPENMTSHEIADFLHDSIHKCGKIAKLPLTQRSQDIENTSARNENLQTQFETS